MEPEENDGDLKWVVERILNSEIISYNRRVCGRNRTVEKLLYVMRWRGYSEDENTWETPEHLEHAQELVEDSYRENQHIRRMG